MRHLVGTIFCLLLFAALTAAQNQSDRQEKAELNPRYPSSDIPRGESIYKFVNEVNLVFSVRDRHGRFRNDLKLDQINLMDDGRPPERISSFEAQSELPLRIAVLIDLSNSIGPRFAFEKEAAVEFLRQTLRPGTDLAFIAGFTTRFQLAQDWTDDVTKMERSVRELRLGGGTALFDTITRASRKFAQEQAPVRRLIVVISDGQDNSSQSTLSSAVAEALRAETIVYTLNTKTPPVAWNQFNPERHGDQALQKLAKGTGGQLLRAEKRKQMSSAFGLIQQELRSQYVLTYKPAQFVADGRFRKIKLGSTVESGLRFSVRPGYYSSPRE